MEKKVLITIRGEQTQDTGETDSTEFTTEGTLTATDYGFLLAYDESALTGMEGVHTAMQLRPRSVILRRSGAFRSRMIYDPGRKHSSPYQTPYGAIALEIATHTLDNTVTENGGALEITYSIALDHQFTSENRLRITVRPISE